MGCCYAAAGVFYMIIMALQSGFQGVATVQYAIVNYF